MKLRVYRHAGAWAYLASYRGVRLSGVAPDRRTAWARQRVAIGVWG